MNDLGSKKVQTSNGANYFDFKDLGAIPNKYVRLKNSSKEVKIQSKVSNFETNLSKNQTTKDRVNPESENVKKCEKSATGSGTNIQRVTPNFSVKKVDVNQDLLLSEDEDSDDDQILSPTKSFKGKN